MSVILIYYSIELTYAVLCPLKKGRNGKGIESIHKFVKLMDQLIVIVHYIRRGRVSNTQYTLYKCTATSFEKINSSLSMEKH